MPKTKTMSKSEMVRQMLEQMGMNASPTEISRKLTAQGHKVTPNLVSGIKLAMKKAGRKGRGRRAGHTADARPSIEDVYQVWALANRIGNDTLKQIIKHMP
jgi:hypothetical protein